MTGEFNLSDPYLPILAALTGGREILSIYRSARYEVTIKPDLTPVTLADIQSNQAISDVLKNTGLPIISEEGPMQAYGERCKWKQLWLVDPLDGTKEFVKHNDQFAVNIALINDGQPIWGLIFAPTEGIIYYGSPQTGITKVVLPNHWEQQNLALLAQHTPRQSISPQTDLQVFTCVTSKSHFSDKSRRLIDLAQQLFTHIDTLNAGSSIKQIWVALGKAHCYPRTGPTMEWDTAAGHALVRAVGGDMYNLQTLEPLTYNKPSLLNPDFICINNHPKSVLYFQNLKQQIH
jgi:3'(2'), 5'-bisphosphate nucleotidase